MDYAQQLPTSALQEVLDALHRGRGTDIHMKNDFYTPQSRIGINEI